ncbi:MAG: hypothetical protein AABY11_02955, partial [archaeon]
LENQTESIEFLLERSSDAGPSLKLSYAYPENLVQPVKVGSQGRSTRWKLADLALVQFIEGGNINIPINTQIIIHLPMGAIIDTTLLPANILVSGNTITISNFKGNALPIEYSVFTPIADPIDAGKIVEDAVKSPLFTLVLAILAVVGMIVVLNREKISERIEEYVIAHSEFKPQRKQDIDADLEGE